MINYLEEAQALQKELSWIRREIHKKPEVGMDLPITTAFVLDQLKKYGLQAEQVIDSGLVANIEGAKSGKTLLLRADMDALDITENSGEPFSSEIEGKMHACGHDMHTTILLGTALLLNKYRDQLHGRVKLIWQPGEEIFAGAKAMIDAGIMENPRVDAALDLHMHAQTPVGNLFYSKGPFTTTADNFLITVKGFGGHGSRPEATVDPLNVANQIYNAVLAMRGREIAASQYVALSICSISSGDSFNILPDQVQMRGTLRTYDQKIRDFIVKRIEEITRNYATNFGAEGHFEIVVSAPTIVNDPEMVDRVTDYLQSFGMEFKTNPSMRLPASDDFGFIASQVPSVMFSLGGKPVGIENNAVHNPKVVFDEKALVVGSALLAHVATKWLEEHA